MHTGKWQPRHLWRNGGKKKCRSLAPHQELHTGQLGGDGSTRAYPDLWHWRCLRYAIPEQRVLTARRHRRTSKHESWSEGTKRWGWWLIRFSWPSQSKSVRTPSKSSITKGTGSHHQHHCWNSCSRMSRRPHQQAPPQNSQEESMALRVNAIRRYLYRVNSRYQKVAPPRRAFMAFIAFIVAFIAFMVFIAFIVGAMIANAICSISGRKGVLSKRLEPWNHETMKHGTWTTWTQSASSVSNSCELKQLHDSRCLGCKPYFTMVPSSNMSRFPIESKHVNDVSNNGISARAQAI